MTNATQKITATPTQKQGGWDVKIKFPNGDEKFLCAGRAPYTLAQSQMAADSARRNFKNHGVVDCS